MEDVKIIPLTAIAIEKPLTELQSTRSGGADQNGHPGRVKARRGLESVQD
jgi:hypothetical protein